MKALTQTLLCLVTKSDGNSEGQHNASTFHYFDGAGLF